MQAENTTPPLMILSPIPVAEVRRLFDDFKEEIKFCIKTASSPKIEDELLTRKQAAFKLGISLVSLSEWTKRGIITGHRISSRIRYKRSELEAALIEIQSA